MRKTNYSSFYIAYCMNCDHNKLKVILETLDDLFNIGYEVEYNFEIEDVFFILNRKQLEHLTKITSHFNNILKIIGE